MKRARMKKRPKMKRRAVPAKPEPLSLDDLLAFVDRDVDLAVSRALRQEDAATAIREIAAVSGQIFDDVSGSVAKTVFGSADPRACKQGCHWCCHQMVTTSPPVVFFLGQAVVSSGALAEPLTAEVKRAAGKVRGLDARRRLALRLPCPLLGEDRTCAVYPVRPLACRGWNTYDADACRRSIESPEAAPEARAHVPQIRIAHTVEDVVVRSLTAFGLAAGPVELIGALALVLDQPDALDRWLAGEDVFEHVRPGPDRGEAALWFARGLGS